MCPLFILNKKNKINKSYRTSWTYQEWNPLHIIHSDSQKQGLSVSNLFKYSLVSLNVGMHTYCYRRTQKACRAGLKGWYTAALLLPLGMLCFVAVLPLKAAEETFLCKCASAHARKQTHPSFMQMFLYLKRIPNRATSAPVDAFNLKASRCWLPNCVWSCQPLLAMGVCLVCNYSTDKDTLWFIGKQLS